MRVLRLIGAAGLLAMAGMLISSSSLVLVASFTIAALVIHLATAPSMSRGLITVWPILLFAGVLALLAWIGGGPTAMLPLKTIGCFLMVVSGVRLIPWPDAASGLRPGSRMGTLILTGLFTRHFVLVLGQEARRLMVAYRLTVPNRWGRGWFGSLAWAVAGLFRRALVRAERFYAAQLARGLGE